MIFFHSTLQIRFTPNNPIESSIYVSPIFLIDVLSPKLLTFSEYKSFISSFDILITPSIISYLDEYGSPEIDSTRTQGRRVAGHARRQPKLIA
jgi:hypothetical protein